MKKISYILLLLGLSLGAYSQEEVTAETQQPKKDVSSFLPAAGDFAIGVDALPYIEFLGSMFGHDNNLYLGQSTIYGKYFLSPDAAVRAELYLDYTTDVSKAYVRDDANVLTNPNAQIEDQRVTKNNNVGFGLGFQKYRGYGKLRGTYGVLASYYMGKSTTEYSWGNEMTTANTNPSSTNWYGAGTNPGSRNLVVKNWGDNAVGIGVITGVEYFILPKICLGGELGLYYTYYWYNQESYTYQTVDQGVVVEYEQATDPADSYSSLTTRVYDDSNVGGRIYLLFHF